MYQAVRSLIGAGVPPASLWWLRLDHPLLMEIDLGTLCRSVVSRWAGPEGPAYLFLDELTYADHWDLWLKTFYDENWPVRILGTSSSTAALRNRRLESGIGRWEEQYLAPYLFSEYLELVGMRLPIPVKPTLAETITACIEGRVDVSGISGARRRFLLTGGFPELLVMSAERARAEPPATDETLLLESQKVLRSDAIERAIYKDIPQAFGVDNPMMLERVLYTLAGQVAGILSPSSICQGLGGLTQPTFDKYLNYLERAFLVFTLPNYSGSEANVQRRGRKLYFVDSAVRNAALQRGLAPLTDPTEMGLLRENMVAAHLHALGEVGQVRLYHWRDRGDEVDVIYDHPDRPLAFEIAAAPTHHRRGLHAFVERFPRFRGRCFLVHPGPEAMRPEPSWDGVGLLPLDLLLLAVGAQAEQELRSRLDTQPLEKGGATGSAAGVAPSTSEVGEGLPEDTEGQATESSAEAEPEAVNDPGSGDGVDQGDPPAGEEIAPAGGA
jgi:predicted AAA+ superfamily ATPase